uniref:Uncharacterized protein n=1 Tax=Anguilla anguilla TaxID=7936 RepID=A0A0E9PJM5_ANGAN
MYSFISFIYTLSLCFNSN